MVLQVGQGQAATFFNRVGPSVAVTDNGRVVYTNTATVFRLLPDGKPDRSFGHRGRVRLPGPNLQIADIQPLARRKLLVVATIAGCGGCGRTVRAMRLQGNGRRDPSFGGGDGFVAFLRSGYSSPPIPGAIHVLGNGGVLLPITISHCSTTMACIPPEGVLVRLTPSGRLNRSFGGGDGLTSTPGEFDAADVGPDGSIVAGGTFFITPLQTTVARFSRTGQLDSAFGKGGSIETTVPLNDLSVGSDGTITIAGSIGQVAGAAKYTPDGSPVMAFGNGGVFEKSYPPSDQVGSAAITRASDLFVATAIGLGCLSSNDQAQCAQGFELIHVTRSGALDPRLGKGGSLFRAAPPDVVMAVTPRYVFALSLISGAGRETFAPARMSRFSRNGRLSRAFGQGGSVILPSR